MEATVLSERPSDTEDGGSRSLETNYFAMQMRSDIARIMRFPVRQFQIYAIKKNKIP
jgi:hypothetical protein